MPGKRYPGETPLAVPAPLTPRRSGMLDSTCNICKLTQAPT